MIFIRICVSPPWKEGRRCVLLFPSRSLLQGQILFTRSHATQACPVAGSGVGVRKNLSSHLLAVGVFMLVIVVIAPVVSQRFVQALKKTLELRGGEKIIALGNL
jgi:hypothetical protein